MTGTTKKTLGLLSGIFGLVICIRLIAALVRDESVVTGPHNGGFLWLFSVASKPGILDLVLLVAGAAGVWSGYMSVTKEVVTEGTRAGTSRRSLEEEFRADTQAVGNQRYVPSKAQVHAEEEDEVFSGGKK